MPRPSPWSAIRPRSAPGWSAWLERLAGAPGRSAWLKCLAGAPVTSAWQERRAQPPGTSAWFERDAVTGPGRQVGAALAVVVCLESGSTLSIAEGEERSMATDHGGDPAVDREANVLVRPFGYVPDRAVIRRIGDRNVYIGNGHAADPAYHDETFEHVLSASSDPYPLTTRHHPLVDGHDVEWQAFEAAVDATRTLIRCGCPSLVHCRAGISRSAAILTAAIAVEDDVGVRNALDRVHDARPLAMPHPALFENAVLYHAANAPSE